MPKVTVDQEPAELDTLPNHDRRRDLRNRSDFEFRQLGKRDHAKDRRDRTSAAISMLGSDDTKAQRISLTIVAARGVTTGVVGRVTHGPSEAPPCRWRRLCRSDPKISMSAQLLRRE
jgi:hypothetical protein